jgi:hypothetical protein
MPIIREGGAGAKKMLPQGAQYINAPVRHVAASLVDTC